MKIKKLLLSMLAILLGLGMTAGGTLAYFQDTEASTGNAFTAGFLDLEIRHQDGQWQDGVSGTWIMYNMEPGDETEGEVELRIKPGSIPADHLEITVSYTVSGSPPLSADEMARVMVITEMEYSKDDNDDNDSQELDLLTQLKDVDGDGKLTLYDLKYGIDNLPPPCGVWEFEMEIKFDEDAGNQFQGKTLDLTVIFTLNQSASQ